MRASLAAARQATAAEQTAQTATAAKEQLDRIEAMLGTLLEALARDATPSLDAESKPKVGRPKVSTS